MAAAIRDSRFWSQNRSNQRETQGHYSNTSYGEMVQLWGNKENDLIWNGEKTMVMGRLSAGLLSESYVDVYGFAMMSFFRFMLLYFRPFCTTLLNTSIATSCVWCYPSIIVSSSRFDMVEIADSCRLFFNSRPMFLCVETIPDPTEVLLSWHQGYEENVSILTLPLNSGPHIFTRLWELLHLLYLFDHWYPHLVEQNNRSSSELIACHY